MTEEQIDYIIDAFLVKFNNMCWNERRDFLIRERSVEYESGPKIKKYTVSHIAEKSENEWNIMGITKGFWIFKKKFPLLKINKFGNKISFSGLYTNNITDFDESLLEQKLEQYLETCKNLPQNAFIRS